MFVEEVTVCVCMDESIKEPMENACMKERKKGTRGKGDSIDAFDVLSVSSPSSLPPYLLQNACYLLFMGCITYELNKSVVFYLSTYLLNPIMHLHLV